VPLDKAWLRVSEGRSRVQCHTAAVIDALRRWMSAPTPNEGEVRPSSAATGTRLWAHSLATGDRHGQVFFGLVTWCTRDRSGGRLLLLSL